MARKAPESAVVKRARSKLKKQIVAEHKLMTKKALDEMNKMIRHWLERHADERIDLRDKTIRLFDENKHPARSESHYVRSLLLGLKKEAKEKEERKSLSGRIKH